MGERENACNQHFLLLLRCFLPYGRQKESFNPFPNKPWFLHVCSTENTVDIGEIAQSNFFLSHSVFYSFGEIFDIFIKFEIVVCKLFKFWKSLKFIVWEKVKVYQKLSYLRRSFQFGPVQHLVIWKRVKMCNGLDLYILETIPANNPMSNSTTPQNFGVVQIENISR